MRAKTCANCGAPLNQTPSNPARWCLECGARQQRVAPPAPALDDDPGADPRLAAPGSAGYSLLIGGLLLLLLLIGVMVVGLRQPDHARKAASSTPQVLAPPLPSATPAVSTELVRWPETSTDAYSYGYSSTNTYRISLKQAGQFIWVAQPVSLSDGTVSVELILRSGPPASAAGLTLREQHDGSLYAFQISAEGAYTFRRLDGTTAEWSVLIPWTTSSAIQTGLNQPNHVAVHMAGPMFSLLINQQLVDARADATYSAGMVGVGVSTFAEGAASVDVETFLIKPSPQP